MEAQTFSDRLAAVVRAKKSVLVVGLDPQVRYMPLPLKEEYGRRCVDPFEAVAQLFVEFNRRIITATAPFAAAFKPQMAFYEEYGHRGVWAFEQTIAAVKAAGMIVIEDAKRCDGGDTAEAYAAGHLGEVELLDGVVRPSPIRVDCMTVVPYIGASCVNPFAKAVKQHGTGIFVVAKSSFTPNSCVEQLVTQSGQKVWEEVALRAEEWGRETEGECGYRNVGVVMGATFPGDAPRMRQILPKSWFLIPGYGGQGGTADQAVVGINQDGLGGVVNSSRGIIYAYRQGAFARDPAQFVEAAAAAAESARNELNDALKRADKWNF